MIVTVFYVSKHITERVSAFAEQLECPDLVEPQIVMRSEYTQTNANDEGADCQPQDECRSGECCVVSRIFTRIELNRRRRFGEPPLPIFGFA